MSSVNKVILLGRLGADPELRHTASDRAVCNLSVATNHVWTDKQGQRQQEVNWHKVVVWGRQGELCSQFLAKGRQVYVEGRLRNYSYEDREGQKRHSVEINADSVHFLGRGGDPQPPAAPEPTLDNVPF